MPRPNVFLTRYKEAPRGARSRGRGAYLLLVKETCRRMKLMASSSMYSLSGGPFPTSPVATAPQAD